MSLLGLGAGSAFGVLAALALMVADGWSGLADGGVLGVLGFAAVLGATYGLLCGAAVGVVLVFLVGRDMPGPYAAWLAFLGAAVTHALALGLLFPEAWTSAGTGFLRAVVAGSALVAGLVAAWFRRRLSNRPRLAVGHD